MATIETAVEPDIETGTPERLSDTELDDIVGGAAPGIICCGCTA